MRPSSALALAISLAAFALPAIAAPNVDVLSQFTWEPEIDGFGGLSGIEVSANGEKFTAVSDNGVLYRGQFQRDNGAISGARLQSETRLVFEGGTRPDEKKNRDAEGLVEQEDGRLHISAEGRARIVSYANDKATPDALALPRTNRQKPKNMGFEALALSPNGTLVTLAEGSENIRAPFVIYEQNAKGWSAFYSLPRHGGFRPVGADFGPKGHLYILSRAFNGFAFAARIERVLISAGMPIGHEQLFISRFGAFDNLEGLAVWQAGDNDLRLYAISDDNFSRAQHTEFVEFRLQD